MARADVDLRLLEPCLALREAQLQHAQLEAQEARRQFDWAQRDADSAGLQVARAESALRRQLNGHGAHFGAIELHALRTAVQALRARAAHSEERRRTAQREMDERQDAVSAADSTVRTLERDIQLLRRRSLRAADDKALALAEDLWTARRKSR